MKLRESEVFHLKENVLELTKRQSMPHEIDRSESIAKAAIKTQTGKFCPKFRSRFPWLLCVERVKSFRRKAEMIEVERKVKFFNNFSEIYSLGNNAKVLRS